jgi:hypothetical protein
MLTQTTDRPPPDRWPIINHWIRSNEIPP